jgi:hypothetical protein
MKEVTRMQSRLRDKGIRENDLKFGLTDSKGGLQSRGVFETIGLLSDRANGIAVLMFRWRQCEHPYSPCWVRKVLTVFFRRNRRSIVKFDGPRKYVQLHRASRKAKSYVMYFSCRHRISSKSGNAREAGYLHRVSGPHTVSTFLLCLGELSPRNTLIRSIILPVEPTGSSCSPAPRVHFPRILLWVAERTR